MTATDAYGNPGNVAAGELIESAWGNAVSEHVVRRFPDEAARDAVWPAATAGVGALAVTIDTTSLWQVSRDAAAVPIWVPVRGIGPIVSRTAQSIPSGSATVISFTAESNDLDGWHAANDSKLIVPAGRAGPRTVDAQGAWAPGGAGTQNGLAIFLNGVAIRETSIPSSAALFGPSIGLTTRRTFAVGDILTFQVFQNTGAAKNFDLRVEISGS